MAKSQTKTPIPFYVSFLAGGIAGITEICITYPLDVVKTRFQLKVGTERVSILSTMGEIVKKEGFTRLYRGILPPILMEAPKRAVKFAANDFYSPLFSSTDNKTGRLVLNQSGAIASGVCAGCTEAVVIVPFELIKIRLQAKENAGLYRNTFDCLSKVVRTEGILALYTGLEATLWRHAIWNGGYFGVIYYVRKVLPEAKTKEGELFRNFTAGALAGTFGTMLNTPSDVVKSRVQNQKDKVNPKYGWHWGAVATIAREEGFSALYKGFLPKVLRLGPGGGIILVVYEVITEMYRQSLLPK